MKILILLPVLAFIFTSAAYAAEAQDEIVIEMHGDPSPSITAPTLWDRTAPQLTRKLRGKTREYLLYTVPVVSDKDRIVHGISKEYALVEYYNGGNFRKFLFQAEPPQTFLSAAATAADVLAVNKKYEVNIGLTQTQFEKFYAQKAFSEADDSLPENTVLYRLSYTDVNTPNPQTRWFLFENKNLTQTFETEKDKDEYLRRYSAQAPDSQAPAVSDPSSQQNRPLRKALISGGTDWDKANLPRAVNPQLIPTPKLKQSSSSHTPI